MKLEINASRPAIHDTSHDRLTLLSAGHRTLIAIADGTTSHPSSEIAAARVANELARSFLSGIFPDDPRDWEAILEAIDQVVWQDSEAGEASALVMLVQYDIAVGASVGDTVAHVIAPHTDPRPLTIHQPSAFEIGSGVAEPIGFGPLALDGQLVTRRAFKNAQPRAKRARTRTTTAAYNPRLA